MKLVRVSKAFQCMACVAALSSCSESELDSSFWIGEWRVVASGYNVVDWHGSSEATYTFREDGSYEYRHGKDHRHAGVFALDGSRFTLVMTADAYSDSGAARGTWWILKNYLYLQFDVVTPRGYGYVNQVLERK